MNISILLGLMLASGVLVVGASEGIDNARVFVSWHAAMIVVGGTLAAALIICPMRHLFSLVKLFVRTCLGRDRSALVDTIREIVEISKSLQSGQPLAAPLGAVRNPFLRESLQLMSQKVLSEAELDEVLQVRIEMQNERYKRDGLNIKVLGKFPPAFGLVGTTMGMIGLLQSVGSPDGFSKIGPSMSLGLVATFYGLVFANFFLIPIGENLGNASESDLMIRRVVVDGVRLLKQEKHPVLVFEYLKSYLTPTERDRFRDVSGSNAAERMAA